MVNEAVDDLADEGTGEATEEPKRPTAAQVTVVDNAGKHRFEIHIDGELAAFSRYREEEPGIFAFSHTETLPQFAGRGLATTLIADTLRQLDAAGHQLLPYCPFVNSYLRKHPDEVRLVPAGDRRRFGLASS